MTKENSTYIIKTYGCQMNEHDSERISYILESLGYTQTEDLMSADLIIYNTCIIRENAELKIYGHLGSMKSLKEKKPELIIAVCGCMMEIEEAREVIRKTYRHVDIVFGTKNISSLPYLITQHLMANERVIDTEAVDDIDNLQKAVRKSDVSAYINIIYGCDNFCSYCIVPYTRGRESSRSAQSILEEVRGLVSQGFKEITLLGQNVNSYGKDLHPCSSFSKLLMELDRLEGLERVRFMTSHPKDFSDELIEAIRQGEKVCEHIHLPLQSGSTRILKEMNRKYTAEEYSQIIEKLRESIPNIAITTDIIVGFPGESDEDFEQTIEMVEKIGFDQAFLFKYSKRTGTRAATMEEQIPEAVKSQRFQRILDRINDICYEKNQHYLDSIQEVLVEGYSKGNKDMLTGRTRTNKIVHFPKGSVQVGELVSLKITGFNSFALEGEMI